MLNRLPTPRNRRLKRALQTIDGFVYPLIERRGREGREDEDFLSLSLFAQTDTGESMRDRQLRDEVARAVY